MVLLKEAAAALL
jgi:hypothetical protein